MRYLVPRLFVIICCLVLALPTRAAVPSTLLRDINNSPTTGASTRSGSGPSIIVGDRLLSVDCTLSNACSVRSTGIKSTDSFLLRDFATRGRIDVMLASHQNRGYIATTYGDIWQTDGTTAGTVRVFASQADARYRIDALFALPRGIFVVAVYGPTDRSSIYRLVNGQLELVQTLSTLWPISPAPVVVVGNTAYIIPYVQPRTIYRTDGTPAGSVQLTTQLNPLGASASIDRFVPHPNQDGMLFSSYEPTSSAQYAVAIWHLSASGAFRRITPRLVVDSDVSLFQVASTETHVFLSFSNPVDGAYVWSYGLNGVGGKLPTERPDILIPVGKRMLIRTIARSDTPMLLSDGTVAGTVAVPVVDATMPPSSTEQRFFTLFDVSTSTTRLMRTDGTVEGTRRIAQVPNSSEISEQWAIAGGWLLVIEGDIWFTDGVSVRRITPSEQENGGSATQSPDMMSVGSHTFFLAGGGLWVTDGTTDGTKQVVSRDVSWMKYQPFKNTLLGGYQNIVLIDTSGTITTLVPQLQGRITEIFAGSTRAFLVEENQVGSRTLWVSDGTPAGTVNVSTLVGRGELYAPIVVGDNMFFGLDRALWMSDGTAAGTRKLDIPIFYDYLASASWNGRAVFATSFNLPANNSRVSELWIIAPQTGASAAPIAVPVGERLELAASGPNLFIRGVGDKRELFVLQDSAPTTPRNITPNWGHSYVQGEIRQLVPKGTSGMVYIDAQTPFFGRELWASDGTSTGTRLVADLYTGIGDGITSPLQAMPNGLVLFGATDGLHGSELWVSDGTTSGTRLWSEVMPGAGSSLPRSASVAGENVVFFADDGVHGIEPHAVRLPTPADLPPIAPVLLPFVRR